MQPIQLLALASRQAEWLQARQEVVAGNIANANTPGYHARDLTPFRAVLDDTNVGMARTDPAHFSSSDFGNNGDVEVKEAPLSQEIGVQGSGNTVALEQELSKFGDIQREYGLNTALVSSFHRLMLAVVKR
jgi:flagellar basal-body rod protein FlgB